MPWSLGHCEEETCPFVPARHTRDKFTAFHLDSRDRVLSVVHDIHRQFAVYALKCYRFTLKLGSRGLSPEVMRVSWPLVGLWFLRLVSVTSSKTCTIKPLGQGIDDTSQIEAAITECGHFGTTVFEPGEYNVTRKMTWDLVSSRVDLHGYLNFKPDLVYWMKPENTYRVIFIQSQASWFVITGHDFEVDAHNTGGIIGNGQLWWSWYGNATRLDGDGRPVALTLSKVTRGTVSNFRIEAQPFWCNAVADSKDVVYDGMYCNATNADPLYFGQNIVSNTDGIDTYRSDNVSLLNWDITCGDDCLAIKGNSTNILARNITCRGGTGIAFGSLGQYHELVDNVNNVQLEDLTMIRPDPQIQPYMRSGVLIETVKGILQIMDRDDYWVPPTGGGGGRGLVSDVVVRSVQLDRVTTPIQLYQTNLGHAGDSPSPLQFKNLAFVNWSGTASTDTNLECSAAAPCEDISFRDISITPTNGQPPTYTCINVASVQLPGQDVV
ncbi:putative galacturan 1,4-alpha-galacturonidase A [Grifola frondosa]|uniref:galacturonan 1,4-alpha-galacturonidase n=1 Tax=Grifola frondosa TaxID=5627 RepID=A0A1C7MK54_GRIFR|nr:putative galacturan 1,4-alpha-galacturonidase A [Grifola frondosa]